MVPTRCPGLCRRPQDSGSRAGGMPACVQPEPEKQGCNRDAEVTTGIFQVQDTLVIHLHAYVYAYTYLYVCIYTYTWMGYGSALLLWPAALGNLCHLSNM